MQGRLGHARHDLLGSTLVTGTAAAVIFNFPCVCLSVFREKGRSVEKMA